jgi:hypothetical protein
MQYTGYTAFARIVVQDGDGLDEIMDLVTGDYWKGGRCYIHPLQSKHCSIHDYL